VDGWWLIAEIGMKLTEIGMIFSLLRVRTEQGLGQSRPEVLQKETKTAKDRGARMRIKSRITITIRIRIRIGRGCIPVGGKTSVPP